MAINYNSMTIEELDETLADLGRQIDSLKEEQRKARRVRNSRATEISARRKVDGMTELERTHARQILGVGGIQTKEKVSEPKVK